MRRRIPVTLELVRQDERFIPKRATDGSAGYDVRANIKGRAITIYRPIFDADGVIVGEGMEGGVMDKDSDFLVLPPCSRARIPLGFKLTLPLDWQADVVARSGTAHRNGLTLANGIGIGDADYPHEYGAILINLGNTPFTVRDGERIAQIVFVPCATADFTFDQVTQTTNRAGGFGHSGRE